MKHVQYFSDFLRDTVNLNQSRIDKLDSHADAIENFLSVHLDAFEKMESQGSYGLKTIIKPVKDSQEFDADLVLYMTYEEDKEPKEYLSDLYKCFRGSKTYRDKVSRKTRCVTVNYAGDCHVDVVPCVTKDDGSMYVCNRKTNELEPTDGAGYKKWFNEKSSITSGHLKRVTRLLKFLRDHKTTFTAKSILLTTLIGVEVDDEAEEDSEDFKNVPTALQTISNGIAVFLQNNVVMPEIKNPALADENFNRHWDQKKYENFREAFCRYNEKINEAVDEQDHNKSVRKWREIFGDDFGQEKSEDNEAATKSAAPAVISVTPRKPYAS